MAGDATALPAHQALRMATRGGAEALAMDERRGQLAPGFDADMVSISLAGLEAQPVHHPEAQLAYSLNDSAVRHCWIAGKPVLEDGNLTTLDEADLLRRAERWKHRMGAA